MVVVVYVLFGFGVDVVLLFCVFVCLFSSFLLYKYFCILIVSQNREIQFQRHNKTKQTLHQNMHMHIVYTVIHIIIYTHINVHMNINIHIVKESFLLYESVGIVPARFGRFWILLNYFI